MSSIRAGERSPKPIEGSTFDLPVDTVIAAMSQEADIEYRGRRGRDEARRRRGYKQSTMKTSADGIFAGGDLVSDTGL